MLLGVQLTLLRFAAAAVSPDATELGSLLVLGGSLVVAAGFARGRSL